MHRRSALRLLAIALVLLFSLPALAAPRDKAAEGKIDEAINKHYFAMDFDKAEGILRGTIEACGNKCSPPVIAKAWMYVGIVQGSGKQDQGKAKEAFLKALGADPTVKLDAALATPETKETFEAAAKEVGAAGGVSTQVTPPAPTGDGPDVPGEMDCTPKVTQVEKRRPVPVACTTEEDAVTAELKYKEFGGERWTTLKMQKQGDFFQAEVPCNATMVAGKLRLYVRARDAAGDTIDQWGSKSKPVEIDIVAKTDAEPPSFPDLDPPERCPEEVECPPGMENSPMCRGGAGQARGDKKWGASCEETQECEAGLICQDGTCETAPSCDVDEDCPDGACVGGYCEMAGGGASGPMKKNWLGVHIGMDLAMVGGSEVCSPNSQENEGFACFYEGTEDQFGNPTFPGAANEIQTGLAPATVRAMLSYDRVLGTNITVGARLGYAFNGGPPAGDTNFLPVHAEARIGYWFGGKDVFAKEGFRPYIVGGGGIAQVDAKLQVTLRDCGTYAGTAVNVPPDEQVECSQAQRDASSYEVRTLDAYKKLGQSFVNIGGGAVYAFSPKMGLQLNLNLMYMLPTTGLVIQPSAGVVMGL